jgi:hypothetical protein
MLLSLEAGIIAKNEGSEHLEGTKENRLFIISHELNFYYCKCPSNFSKDIKFQHKR